MGRSLKDIEFGFEMPDDIEVSSQAGFVEVKEESKANHRRSISSRSRKSLPKKEWGDKLGIYKNRLEKIIADMKWKWVNWKQKRRRRRKVSWKSNQPVLGLWNRAKLIRAIAVFGFASVIGGVFFGGVIFAWFARDLPSPDKVVRQEGFSTKLFDRDGNLLYDVFDEERRIPVKIEDVPDDLKNAVVAVEDKDFYTHGGFDPKGMLRSLFVNIFRGKRYGGSTLTQQLVKNALLSQEKTISRKIKEFVLAVQIERKFNKDQIMQMYLNETPYGGTAWGIVAAAETYFSKPVTDLDLVESAILAGLPQRPSAYSPFSSTPDAYIGRTTHVLRRMREDGYIDKETEQSAVEELSEVKFASSSGQIKAPHFVFYVIDKLSELYGKDMVEKGGLRVTTTLDSEIHEAAQEIVSEEIADVASYGIGNGAALVVNSKTGEVLSMVGSKDFHAQDYDGQVNVVLSLRQPGSAIKPITYAQALEEGFTPATVLADVPTEFPGGAGNPPYKPVNYDGNYRGLVSLRNALGSSLNIPAVKLLSLVGVEDMLGLAYNMGIDSLEPTKENMSRFGLSVTLGGGEVRLLDLATAYGAFSNGGLAVEPVSILRVEDGKGNLMFEHKHIDGERVLSEQTSFLINDMLSDNEARLMTFGANSYLNMNGRPIAVKTGTTNDKRDNWTVGWSDQIVVGVWVGNNDNSPMKNVASGVSGASPIWRRIILEAIGKYPAGSFEVPDGVESVFVDSISGYPEHDGFPSRSAYVAFGTLPTAPDPIHTKLKLCPGQNKLATASMIAGGRYEEKEYIVMREDDPYGGDVNRWQEGIDAWIAGNGDERYHPPTEHCESEESGVVRINSPEHKKDYDGDSIEVDLDVYADKKIEKVEVWINGDKKETLDNKPYKVNIKLDPGSYELQGRAKLEGGDEITSGTLRFGMGGKSWDESNNEPDPTPTPTPAVAPSPTPSSEEED